MEFLSALHFLRPWWLVLLPCWLLLSLALWRRQRSSDGWSALCDPALLGYLVGAVTRQQRSRPALAALIIAGVAAVVALAGPAWKQLPQPVFRVHSALIIVLDLSQSMLAEDMRPNRLMRARQKLQDILGVRNEGQTGLIVFAGSAFDVVPLTTDNRAILAMLEALEPSMMPVQGSSASSALERAIAMFRRGAIRHGSVVMLADGVDADAASVAGELVQAGHRLSVLGIGTDAGAPIPSAGGGGGFLKDSSGNIVIPRLDTPALRALAEAGHGVYQSVRVDDLDVKSLPGLIPAQGERAKQEDMQTDRWQEEGPWLVLLIILPLLSLAFRRGVLLAVFLLPVLFPDLSHAIEWQDLWQRPDQQGQALLQQEQSEQAAEIFSNPEWKAAALYRAEKYRESAEALDDIASADAWYNRGNALAKSGDLKAAARAYEQALNMDKTHEDAAFNLDLVKKAMQKQQSEQQSDDQDKSGKNDKSEQQSGEKKQGDQSSQHSEQSEQPSSSQDEQDQSENRPGQNNDSQSQSPDTSQQQPDKQQQGENEQNRPGQDDQARDEAEQQQQPAQSAEHEEQHKAGPEEEKAATGTQGEEMDARDKEEMKARQHWLRRIPDDPGGLLRRKFRYQYSQRGQQPENREGQAW